MNFEKTNLIYAPLMCLILTAVACNTGQQLSLRSPYNLGEHQHKVQLHTHTINSDGDHDPQWVMQAYQDLGYAAVAITDHDYTRNENANLHDPQGHNIIHIRGIEYSGDESERSWNHMLGINIATIHHAEGTGNRQAQIDQARLEGGLSFLCHPYDEDKVHGRGWDGEDILELVNGFHGIEIHNGASYHEPGSGRDYPYKVDMALTAGRELNVIAVDDFHRNPDTTLDRGYVVITSDLDAEAITEDAVISALASGNFFSAGRVNNSHPIPPHFTNISVNGNRITAETDKPADIEFITARNNYYLEGQNYAHKSQGAGRAQYVASPDDVFVRIKASYTQDGNTSHAWSNPIYVGK